MAVPLSGAIAAYFAADRGRDPEAVAACFTPTAIVRDEGRAYTGCAAIRAWKAESSSRYSYTVEPIAIRFQADRTVVTGHLVGDFPGSPIDLRYAFTIDGDRIAELEIAA